ncbi:DMT family transporter [Nocardioides jiangxiensis]|uniref:DMT family transporter n=1 Tax=Nocardioides jiangxiensis TaxID=3064524 RepID=A0ABT9B737_9ACTN|nr:DMT family transporter [Nocardioides sp. WY-20]MDO7868953.1 DMT family transporter [Nocardioides sp. WY-20]
MTTEQPPVRVWLPWLIGLAAIWGCSFLFISVGVRELHPAYVTLGRVSSGAIAVLVLMAFTGHRLPRDVVTWLHLAVPGLLIAFAFTLFGFGEQRIPSLLAGIWNGTTPLVTLPAAVLLFRTERFSLAKVVGLVLGFGGTLVVLGAWHGLSGSGFTGQMLCFAAASCYGIAIPYQHRYVAPRVDSDLAVSAGQLLWATAALAVVAPFVAGVPPAPWDLSPEVVASVLTLGAVGTGIALAIHARNIRWVGGSTASYVTYLSPLFAIAVGMVVLGEEPHWYQPVGGAVILLGVAIAQGRIRIGPRPVAVTPAEGQA